jgi:hypothetical protein
MLKNVPSFIDKVANVRTYVPPNPQATVFPDRTLLNVPKTCLDAVQRDRAEGERVMRSLLSQSEDPFAEGYRDEYGLQPGMLMFYYGVGGTVIKDVLGNKSALGNLLTANNPISHWGIYVGMGRIMEIGAPKGKEGEVCLKRGFGGSMRGTRLVRVEDWLSWGNGAIYRKTYERMFDHRKIVERALFLMNDIRYSLLGRFGKGRIDPKTSQLIEGNCEMLSNYIATGIAESLQVTSLWRVLGRTVLAIAPFFLRPMDEGEEGIVDLTDEGCICKDECRRGWLYGKTCGVWRPGTCGGQERASCAKGRKAVVEVSPKKKGKTTVRVKKTTRA